MRLQRIAEAPAQPPAAPPSGFALWALGFRPFYLGGALFAVAAMLGWLAELDGHPLPALHPYMPGMLWHVHEMIFGFAAAIVTGFLLTAVRAWTTVTPAEGKSLAALWTLWLVGRIAVGYASAPIAFVLDFAFLPISAIVLLRVLIHAKNRHNLFLPMALGLLATANLVFHIAAMNGRVDVALHSAYVAVGLLVLFVTIIGGRVIPMFTTNAVPGHQVRKWKFVESSIMGLTLLTFLLDGFGVSGVVLAVAAVVTSGVQAMRVIGWHPWRVGNRPILTILHISYAWIPFGFVMLALAAVDVIPHSLAIHTFTVGAVGGAIIGMMTRTARGHTGRPLVAGSVDIVCYSLLVLAALIRVLVPAVAPQQTYIALDVSASCWILAFSCYFVRYAGWLAKPRIDGKPG